MKGLDNYIMGINDPNAPFNQTEWTETIDVAPVLECAGWVTDQMLNVQEEYEKLGEIFESTIEDFIHDYQQPSEDELYFHYTYKYEREFVITMCAQEIADECKQKYLNINK